MPFFIMTALRISLPNHLNTNTMHDNRIVRWCRWHPYIISRRQRANSARPASTSLMNADRVGQLPRNAYGRLNTKININVGNQMCGNVTFYLLPFIVTRRIIVVYGSLWPQCCTRFFQTLAKINEQWLRRDVESLKSPLNDWIIWFVVSLYPAKGVCEVNKSQHIKK